MKIRLKKLPEQVLVITGASSGIGLATAQLAARKGARVVLSSRDEVDLSRATEEIRRQGGRVFHLVGDVADFPAMRALADAAVREFGRIDTWINNAGVSIYGPIEQVRLEDARRLFETNYWGVVHGSLAALAYLKRTGGALINVGSVLSETAYPLQGHYVASKHAVKGFTESLRLELEKEGAPVSVTLIEPAAINTPYPEHAKSYLGTEPQHQPPVYAPEVVADAILHCAEHPMRTVQVGGGAKVFSLLESIAPRAGDRFKEATSFEAQRSDRPAPAEDALHHPVPNDARVHGDYPGRVMRTSLYTRARLSPTARLVGLAALGAGITLAARAAAGAGRRDAVEPVETASIH
ncbi:MAG TPA: SDR family oxidoreductase [Gemmatimonadales bacterium]|nr:SDR family oxidoreductase [Gemmatimonadales bacterium]